MSHGILENDTMFSVLKKPWHGLGTVVETAPSVREAIKLAKLDWEVELRTIFTDDDAEITTHKAVVRKDTSKILGVVGSSYCPLQNIEAFDWFEPFIDRKLATLETAGSLFNGKKVWILAKTLREEDVVKGDSIESYILLSNSHNGSSAVRVGFTPIRVVCNNTLSAAERDNLSKLIRIKHTYGVAETMKMIRDVMDTVNSQFTATIDQYRALTKRDVSVEDLHKYVKLVFSSQKLENFIDNKEAREQAELEAERKKIMEKVEAYFELEKRKTAWNMYNAVNTYFNHASGKTVDNRLNSLWFGGNTSRLDQKALRLALRDYT